MGNSSVREHHQHDDDQAPTMVAKASIASSSTSDADSRTYDNWSDTTQPYISSHVCGEGQLLPTVFRWDGNGKEVYISTSHDNWQAKIPLVKSRHDFFTVVDLPLGSHQYKYFVDGQWLCDPKEETIPNTFGTQNNVMSVKQTDFEVFEALGVDSISTGHMNDDFSSSRYYRPTSPPGDYTKIIPPKETRRRVVPPILPQQLLQIILNQEVPKHCEPFLLPEPNHVMLNHLYALSIKDGVMILSTTHRYRKKYITTVLYKPI